MSRPETEEDLADVLPGIPVLAAIPRWRPGQRWRREASEGYFNLGVSLRSVNGSVPAATSYLITSALGEDGKSTTALNLALALGREGRNALLVDGDLRRPRVTEMLGAPRGDEVTILEYIKNERAKGGEPTNWAKIKLPALSTAITR